MTKGLIFLHVLRTIKLNHSCNSLSQNSYLNTTRATTKVAFNGYWYFESWLQLSVTVWGTSNTSETGASRSSMTGNRYQLNLGLVLTLTSFQQSHL